MHVLTEEALKGRLAARGVPIPAGDVVTAANVETAPVPDHRPLMVKGLAAMTDRAKHGLIVRAESAQSARETASRMLGTKVNGHTINRVLIEEAADDGDEYYLAAAFDYVRGEPIFLCGAGGSGVEHRSAPQDFPISLTQPPDLSPLPPALRTVGSALVAEFIALRAKSVELNPVRVTPGGAVVLDAKASLDPTVPAPADAVSLDDPDDGDARLQERARSLPGGTEVRFGRLDGTIGLVTAGGGVLAIIHDALRRHHLRPANFADVSGGTATTELLGAVAQEVLRLQPEGILIVTGITSSISVTHFAEAMVAALAPLPRQGGAAPPVVARMAGPAEEEAATIMRELPNCLTVGRDVTVEESVALLAERLGATRADQVVRG